MGNIVPIALVNSGEFDLEKVEAVSRSFVEKLGKDVRGLYDWAVKNVSDKRIEGASVATMNAYYALTNQQERITAGSAEEIYVGLAMKEAFFATAASIDPEVVSVLAQHFPKATTYSAQDIEQVGKLGFSVTAKIAAQAASLDR